MFFLRRTIGLTVGVRMSESGKVRGIYTTSAATLSHQTGANQRASLPHPDAPAPYGKVRHPLRFLKFLFKKIDKLIFS